MLKHYVEFIYLGSLTATYSSQEISARNPELVSLPENAFGYRFYTTVVIDSTGSRASKDYSGWYYQGEKLSLPELKERFGNNPDYAALIFNMEVNNIDYVVMTKFGSALFLRDSDTVF